jgi:hypothetical protein
MVSAEGRDMGCFFWGNGCAAIFGLVLAGSGDSDF